MKKISLVLGLFCCMFVLNGCGKVEKTTPLTEEETKFKTEYEAINGKTINDSTYTTITVPEDNDIVYSNEEEIIKLLKSGTGVIYFGYPECPWCRNAVPVLVDAVKELKIGKIYYFNGKDIRDKKSVDENGNVVTEKEGTSEYYQILEALGNFADDYDGIPNAKRLYFPTVVVVKDGKIIGTHASTVDSQKDPSILLKEDQKEELKEIYQNYLSKISSTVCNEAC